MRRQPTQPVLISTAIAGLSLFPAVHVIHNPEGGSAVISPIPAARAAQTRQAQQQQTQQQHDQQHDQNNNNQQKANQYRQDENEKGKASRHDQDRATFTFQTWDQLEGESVVGTNGDDLGEIESIIAERGSGRLRAIVIESGGVLGVGAHTYAVPFAAADWKMADDNHDARCVINLTKDQIRSIPEFSNTDWSSLESDDWVQQMKSWFGDLWPEDHEPGRRAEAFQQSLRNRETTDLSGTITTIDRTQRPYSTDHVILTVNTNSEGTVKADLGPAWYVLSQSSVPFRAEHIEMTAWPMPQEMHTRMMNNDNQGSAHQPGMARGDQGMRSMYVVRSAVIDGTSVQYRNENGDPQWYADQPQEGNANRNRVQDLKARYFMIGDLEGQPLHARTEKVGEVDHIILGEDACRIAFLGFSSDDLLDLGDQERLVPWEIASFQQQKGVCVDATASMLNHAMKMPDRMASLRNRSAVEEAYRPFDVRPEALTQMHASARSGSMRNASPGDMRGWSHSGRLARAVRNGETTTISGEFLSMGQHDLPQPLGEARVMNVDDGQPREVTTVVLGPDWYTDEDHALDLERGDEVTVNARRISLGGEERLIACSVSSKSSGKTCTLWSRDGRPSWDGGGE